jgi:hypothetical protein
MQTPQREEILPLLADLSSSNFEQVADLVFAYQKVNSPLYAEYLQLLGPNHHRPFLPISFFKTHDARSGNWLPETTFKSSGTRGQLNSLHPVRDLQLYLENTRRGFSYLYGDPANYCFLALLPNYLERGNSSLVAMADYFIKLSKYRESGFFLNDFDQLERALINCQSNAYPTILLGVSFALLDFSETHAMDLSNIIIMETGGMKGRRKELTRSELHQTLQSAFRVKEIHSEYGMTELFSQGYAQGGSVFSPCPSMKVIATELNDPFCQVPPGKTGVLNLIDLANIDTLSFIQTEDLGRVYPDGRFEVLGRLDSSELRGCNLMVE